MPSATARTTWRDRVGRAGRGLSTLAAGLLFPLGGWWLGRPRRLYEPDRLPHGLAVVLPGIEGWGPLNWSIARGLNDGGFAGAVLVHDWTTGWWPLFPFHLRAEGRGRRRAAGVVRIIQDYQSRHPGRPVHLVGHSGGAAVAVWVLEALPPDHPVSTVVLLGAALSPSYPVGRAVSRAGRGVWHFWSPLDCFFLGIGTALVGTSDGRHSVSAGMCGFSSPRGADREAEPDRRDRLRQVCYRPRMARQFHTGGHLGWANRVFVAETVAPLLGEGDDPTAVTRRQA